LKSSVVDIGFSRSAGIVDPAQAREARAGTFLNVPLYNLVFENHKGGALPTAVALKREMADSQIRHGGKANPHCTAGNWTDPLNTPTSLSMEKNGGYARNLGARGAAPV
jgi:hypothetical protein